MSMTDTPTPPRADQAAPISTDDLRKLLDGATPDWCVYGEPEVGLMPSLFAGKPMREGFGPIEPLQGCDLDLAALAPQLAAEVLARRADLAAPSAPAEVEGLVRDCINADAFLSYYDTFAKERSALTRAATALTSLQAENKRLKTAGIAEIAAINPNVMDCMRHWESRAEKAEGALAEIDGLLHEAIPALEITGVNVSLAADLKVAHAKLKGEA